MKSPVDLLSCLFDDIERQDPSVRGLSRDLRTAKLRFEHEGFGFFTRTLPTLCDALDRALADGTFHCPTSFKKKGALPVFLQGLLGKVFDKPTGTLLPHACIHSVKSLREITRMFKKLITSQAHEDKLHKKACDEFLETDYDIRSFDRLSWPTLQSLARLSLQDLNFYNPEEIVCKNGPGSVREGFTSNQKWNGVLAAVFDHDYLNTRFGYSNFVHEVAIDNGEFKRHNRSGIVSSLNFPVGISKLITVPKTSTSRRTITVEPCLHQFVQQGLNRVIRGAILKCSILRNSLDLKDQSLNQSLALSGSRTGNLATIDLKSASDRLSLTLVKTVFAGKEILTDLLDSRSKLSIVDNNTFELSKYAGMGNATTFPVQSICFALICIAAILDEDGMKPSLRNARRASKYVRVYGDDIIIPSKYYTSVSSRLSYCGLQVNHNKSFSTGLFRESCGVDAFKGVDVTPIYLRSWSALPSEKPKHVQHLIALANSSFDRALYSVSRYFQKEVESLVGPLPIVRRDSPSLGWHTRVDSNVAHKWDGKQQRLVFRGLVSQPLKKADPLDGYAALLRYFHESEGRPPSHSLDYLDPSIELSFQSSQQRFRQRLRWRWLPA